jgi:hypothetical protein
MADKDMENFEELDDIDKLMESEELNFEEPTEEVNNENRDPVERVLVNTKEVVKEKMSADQVMDLSKKVLERSLPKTIEDKVSGANSIKETVENTLKENIEPVRQSADNFLGNLESMTDENSLVGNIVRKLRSYTKKESGSYSKEETLDEKALKLVNGIIAEDMISKELYQQQLASELEAIQNLKQNEILARILAHEKVFQDKKLSMDFGYYRKSLELQYKQTILIEKLYKLFEADLPAKGKQLEAIVKNTALPDIIKLKSKDYLVHMAKEKMIDAAFNFLSKNSFIENIKNRLKEKIESGISAIGNVLDMSNMLLETRNMAIEMGEDPTKLLIENIIEGALLKAGSSVGKKVLEKATRTVYGRKAREHFERIASDPKHGALELADKLREKVELIMKY